VQIDNKERICIIENPNPVFVGVHPMLPKQKALFRPKGLQRAKSG
jgi:hypothetical protein